MRISMQALAIFLCLVATLGQTWVEDYLSNLGTKWPDPTGDFTALFARGNLECLSRCLHGARPVTPIKKQVADWLGLALALCLEPTRP